MWWPFKSKAEKEEPLLESLARINKVNRYIYNTIKDAEERAFAVSPSFETCHDCGGQFLKEKMQKVEYKLDYGMGGIISNDYFCLSHKRKYDRVENSRYYKTIPAKEVECDENGKIIKGK